MPEFIPIETLSSPCPGCGGVLRTTKQVQDFVEFECEGAFCGGDTIPHEYFGKGQPWSQYGASLEMFLCPECSVEIYDIILCVPSWSDHSDPHFLHDGFEIADREQLLQVKAQEETWRCVRKYCVNTNMGEFSKVYRRFDLHVWGPFLVGEYLGVMWNEASTFLEKRGPVCLEHMKAWEQTEAAENER
ncbi:MAG: hypothetical protein JEY79_14140 [Pseudodesulfovibrio sp.]|nr:hypothetical protein [Pseudodesulfovibrio sp.]